MCRCVVPRKANDVSRTGQLDSSPTPDASTLMNAQPQADTGAENQPQCRICFDGPDIELGRLIRPCRCSGSIAYIHTQCLQRWRKESQLAFFQCPQCHYEYRTARTNALGLASNQVIIASLSVFLFLCMSFFASFLVTYLLDAGQRHTGFGFGFFGFYFVSPSQVVGNILAILRDEEIIPEELFSFSSPHIPGVRYFDISSLGKAGIFLKRVLIGIPVLGVASLVQFLYSVSFLGPAHLFTRHAGRGRNRRESSIDIATIIILGAVILGTLRALRGIYRITEKGVRYGLTRAEDMILEVN